MSLISHIWNHVELTKHEPEEIKETLCQSNNYFFDKSLIVTPLKNKTDFGYIAEYEKDILINFRGTEGLKACANNLKSYLSDDLLDDINEEYIHSGLFESWKYFEEVIIEYLRNSLNTKDLKEIAHLKNLYFNGKSRGGGEASLAHYLFAARGIKSNCYTFGAMKTMKVINKKWQDDIIHNTNHIRVIVENDIVPRLYKNLDHYNSLTSTIVLEKPFSFFPSIKSHFDSSYTKELIKSFPEDKDLLKGILKRCKT